MLRSPEENSSVNSEALDTLDLFPEEDINSTYSKRMEFNDSALADLNNANDVHPLRGANSQMERIKGFEGEAEHPDPIPCQLVVMALEGDRSIVLTRQLQKNNAKEPGGVT